jgi:hypothetical protein
VSPASHQVAGKFVRHTLPYPDIARLFFRHPINVLRGYLPSAFFIDPDFDHESAISRPKNGRRSRISTDVGAIDFAD